jgi:CheY-like chemotaxis protein
MEAVGQLAGGIAHDFNNQLGVVIGYLDFLHDHLANEATASQWVETATNATLRCMELTRQLLAFSRTRPKETITADLNQELAKMDKLITRAITPSITVQSFPGENLWPAAIDPGEFQDAILNLVINARDAMPEGGKLIIETTNKLVDAHYASLNPDLSPGKYVQVMISDSGEGMDSKTRERIFEPFFTTKAEGKGTGLGLAMVYGFAKRYGGEVKVYSEQNIGTTFRLYLPSSEIETNAAMKNHTASLAPTGSERVLIVDDEKDLLELAERYLQNLGYRTLSADNPQDALSLLAKHKDIDLLFSDVVMPGEMNGYVLAEQAVKQQKDLKVLLTSGFSSNTTAVNGQAKFNANLLHKPYRQHELAQRVRSVLDQQG